MQYKPLKINCNDGTMMELNHKGTLLLIPSIVIGLFRKLFGLYSNRCFIRNSIVNQLNQRTEFLECVWYDYNPDIVLFVCMTISDIMIWPNWYFIPDDPLWLVLFDNYPSNDDLHFIMDIEEKFNFKFPQGALMQEGLTLGQFINIVQKLQNTQAL